MTILRRLASILDWLLHRDREERQLDDELRAFVEMSAADKVRDGTSPAAARRQAILELGGIEQVKERVRTDRHGGWLDEVGRDVRYAVRLIGRSPGFAAVVMLTLALGIGANTAIFSLIDALMLRWLPVRDPQQLVQLQFQSPDGGGPPDESFSYAIVRALDQRREIFDGLAGFSGETFHVGSGDSVLRVSGALVTGGFYETLGLQPAAGRLLTREDDAPGAALAAVISDGYWERGYARSPDVVGQTIRINGLPVTIAGVSPRGFVGANVGAVADITMTVAALPQVSPDAAPLLAPGNFWLRVLARPAAELSNREAAARLNTVWSQIADQVIAPHWPPARRQEMAASVLMLSPGGTGWTYLRETYRRPLFVLMAAAGVVLLIACANVAGLLLARASARQREIAVRLAIGAGRGRIVRQLLIESTLLALIGGAAGVLLAWISSRVLVDILPGDRIVLDMTPNWRVLGFTSAVAIATGLLFGVAPALQTTAAGPLAALRQDVRAGSRSRLLPSLISAQVALSLVLLAAAGLFVRTLQNLHDLDPGFAAGGVLLVDLEGRRSAIPGDLVDQIRRVPGVVSASVSTHTPLSGASWSEAAVPAGQPLPERDSALLVGAGPGFFATMQTRVRAGREFTDRDTANGPAVAVINERFAERHFAGRNPVGQHLTARVRDDLRDLEIVGVVDDVRTRDLRERPAPTVYVAYTQLAGNFPSTITVRTGGPVARVGAAIEQLLQPKLPGVPIAIRPLSAQVEATLVRERMMAALASAFGLLALALACVGLYGLLAYGVAQRIREIGIRMALGAPGARVVALVLGRGARLVLIGIAAGLPAAWFASRWVESMLFGLTRTDPVSIGGATVLLAAAAQLAAYLPARRASRVDPMVALRHE